MSKFASVIEAARKTDTMGDVPSPAAVILRTRETGKKGKQVTGSPATWEPEKTASPKPGKPYKSEAGKKGTLEGVSTVSHEAVITASQQPVRTSNLTVTIPTGHRNYWVGEARKRGTTVTAVIVEALSAKLGHPDQ